MYRIDFIPTKRRVRFTFSGHPYNDPKNEVEKQLIQYAYKGGLHRGAVRVVIITYGKLPKNKKQPEANVYKPDADNTAKAILDALNGIAYLDDKQITTLIVQKKQREKREKSYTEFGVFDDLDRD